MIAVSDGVAVLEPVPAKVEFVLPKGIGGWRLLKGLSAKMMTGVQIIPGQPYAATVQWSGVLQVINVLNPQSPFIVKSLDFSGYGISNLKGLKITGNYIYVVNEQSIISVSISQVEDPIISGILAGLGPIKDFIFNDTYGILAQGINGLAL